MKRAVKSVLLLSAILLAFNGAPTAVAMKRSVVHQKRPITKRFLTRQRRSTARHAERVLRRAKGKQVKAEAALEELAPLLTVGPEEETVPVEFGPGRSSGHVRRLVESAKTGKTHVGVWRSGLELVARPGMTERQVKAPLIAKIARARVSEAEEMAETARRQATAMASFTGTLRFEPPADLELVSMGIVRPGQQLHGSTEIHSPNRHPFSLQLLTNEQMAVLLRQAELHKGLVLHCLDGKAKVVGVDHLGDSIERYSFSKYGFPVALTEK